MPRPARVSPDRIRAAAALEFAERGYAGARVDRIARRARVNKAMLYYHFASKQALYRDLLRSTFSSLAAELEGIASLPLAPPDRLDAAITAMAAFVDHLQPLKKLPDSIVDLISEFLAQSNVILKSSRQIPEHRIDFGR